MVLQNGRVNRSCGFHVSSYSYLLLSVVHQFSLLFGHDRMMTCTASELVTPVYCSSKGRTIH
jgi:hypothetical protein